MCLVISMSSLFFLILGWDGLGLVSFFLIVYYQNQRSIFSGLFTLLINRIGDAFFLCSIVLYFFSFPDLFVAQSTTPNIWVLSFLTITFMTKRAIFPFSPWLPIAIAAPTPISALVHSSTLVTSGLFLIIKFSYVLYSSYSLTFILLVLSLFTSFYAGINTIFEKDLKKLIALSTLSHLGFICMSFSLGLLDLSFFHLVSHALFKSLLFMTIGDIIINLGHSQDIRYLSSGFILTPSSYFFMSVSLLNLIGIPSLVGFFSKDLVLEISNYTNLSRALYLALIVNLFFTFYYTYQLFYYSFSYIKYSSYSQFHSPSRLHSLLLLFLSMLTLVFGTFFLSLISCCIVFPPLPLPSKLVPILLNVFFFFSLFISLKMFTSQNQAINSYFSTIIFLYLFITKVSSRLHYLSSFYLVKSFESGFMDTSFNKKLSNLLFFSSSKLLSVATFSPLVVRLLAIAISILFYFI